MQGNLDRPNCYMGMPNYSCGPLMDAHLGFIFHWLLMLIDLGYLAVRNTIHSVHSAFDDVAHDRDGPHYVLGRTRMKRAWGRK